MKEAIWIFIYSDKHEVKVNCTINTSSKEVYDIAEIDDPALGEKHGEIVNFAVEVDGKRHEVSKSNDRYFLTV